MYDIYKTNTQTKTLPCITFWKILINDYIQDARKIIPFTVLGYKT